ncbi:SRPBCC family protein [Hoeflea prorocentri]|uniref:SRPBCC family protein n=1 Tax=Hoeflea prorocentri TaxID=1922333 RepID=A0A9X3UQH8_9HYPH|nr:SRPBCC family protein [Hoeflea prorocentri]MCY6383346.1 SRPBCC family protein [Hoeflea prorocentri]MDA5401146.1 SRPBCC family protein [Hoeflea prorocentri]
MELDNALGATFREVGSGERDGKPTHIVRASRSYATTPDDLWHAVTDAERIRRWFANVTGDLNEGGRFSIEGNADGDIVACEPPRLLVLTWEFGGNTSWVKVVIEQSDDGALLTLEHEHPTDERSQAHWNAYGPGATGVGWELAMLGLDVHLASDGSSTLDAGMKWAEGPTGKAMLRSWAEAWGMAHADAGTDPQVAMNSAERTARFYTGESQ